MAHPVVVLFGPTTSGKSALAMHLAEHFPFTIINADAMQMYRDLRILTARPKPEEEQRIPHALYGVWSANYHGTVADWVKIVLEEMGRVLRDGRIPLLVGGTGLYIKSLMEGLSTIPPIPQEVRKKAEENLEAWGNAEFYQKLIALDPHVATHLDRGNTQRLLRAWEVMTHTGISLYEWHVRNPLRPAGSFSFHVIALAPDRDLLYRRAEARFSSMMQEGAVEEVGELLALNLDPGLPLLRAHGVPEITAFLGGQQTRAEAILKAQQNTRHYIKRQFTWLRHQMQPDLLLIDSDVNNMAKDALNFIKGLKLQESSSTPFNQ